MSNGADQLKMLVERRIKSVFKKCLDCVEIRFGKEFDGFDKMRKEILRVGNDAIRDCKEHIDRGYKVEKLPVTAVKVEGKEPRNVPARDQAV